MTKLLAFLFVFGCHFLAPSSARADMCVALIKGEKGYADKISTLKRVASISHSTTEQAKLKEYIDQIRDMCSYKIFIELLKKDRNWEPYVYSSALAAKTTDAQDAFIELVTKHPGKWQPATYRCASQIDSKEKTKLFKQMIEQAVRVDFPAIAYDVLADINNEAQLEAFSSILQKRTSFNWKDAVFKTVKSFKVTKPDPNYPLLAFKTMLYKVENKDWPAETYSQLESLRTNATYVRFLKKNALELVATIFDRLEIESPFDTYFDHQILESLIKDNNIGSIEQLLPLLPIWLRSNYTLMFYSRSNQEASFQKPRAIMYTPLADFIATFNDRTMKGGNIIETISVNKKTFEFEFREIVFKNGKAQFSAINPLKCATCHHGNDLKPNWDEYSFWLGAYGMDEDIINSKVFSKAMSRNSKFVTPQDIIDTETMLKKIGGMSALENTFEEYKKFRAAKPKHPRYQHLADSASTPLKYHPYSEAGVQTPVVDLILGVPNELLNEFIGVWNIQRIFHRIKNAPAYKRERMNLLHFLAGCEYKTQSRYDDLFTKRLGIDYLKMTDLTFGRDQKLLNDIVDTDYRLAYLFTEDIKDDIPELAGHMKASTSSDPRYKGMLRIAPKLLVPSVFAWGGCAVLEKTMKQNPN